MHNGSMTAQWNGKLRNVKVFDRALTDVITLQFLFTSKAKLFVVQGEIIEESKGAD